MWLNLLRRLKVICLLAALLRVEGPAGVGVERMNFKSRTASIALAVQDLSTNAVYMYTVYCKHVQQYTVRMCNSILDACATVYCTHVQQYTVRM